MATSDTNVPQVIVNKLTMADYTTATKNANEFYAVTDLDGVYAETVAPITAVGAVTTNNIADSAVTSAKIDWSSFLERRTLTLTTDSYGNKATNIPYATYDVISCHCSNPGSGRNVVVVPYTWMDGNWQIHVELSGGGAAFTGTLEVEFLLLDKTKTGV